MSGFPLQSLLERTVDFLENRCIDYMVMGGIAVRFWGIPRPTFDLDFTLALMPEEVPGICVELRGEGFSVPEAHERGFVDQLAGMKKFAVVQYCEGQEVGLDMFLVTTTYQESAFGRRVRRKLNDRDGWLISPEDLILHKLISGRERDLADVLDVLWMNPDLDRSYLGRWAPELGISGELERMLATPLP